MDPFGGLRRRVAGGLAGTTNIFHVPLTTLAAIANRIAAKINSDDANAL